MAERTPPADGEKAAEIAPDKTVDIDGGVLSTGTPAVAEDGSEIKRRAKRNIITEPEWQSKEIERDGTCYRRDANGQWRPVLY